MRRRIAATTMAFAATVAGAGAGVWAMAQREVMPPLVARLAPGRWQVHEIGGGAAPRDVCVAEPMHLVQLRHGARACAHVLIGTAGKSATIHYTCNGSGHGQTILTVESPGLVRVQTQGIADGQPFDLDLEARRQGAC